MHAYVMYARDVCRLHTSTVPERCPGPQSRWWLQAEGPHDWPQIPPVAGLSPQI